MRIVLIEDEAVSAGISRRMLKEAGLDSDIAAAGSIAAAVPLLAGTGRGVVLLDLGLPDSSGIDTVITVCSRFPLLPVIVMTGTDDEDMGLNALRYGAQDYLVKGQFDDRLLKRVIRYALERKDLTNDKESLITRLENALTRVNQLTGLLPTCCVCKKIRTPEGKWVQMETYISERSAATFSHGFCDECFKKNMKAAGK